MKTFAVLFSKKNSRARVINKFTKRPTLGANEPLLEI